MEWLFLSICAGLIAVSILFIALYAKNNRRIKNLSESIERFIAGENATAFSTSDDRIGILQNNICELEHLLALEKNNTLTEIKKNSDFIADISHQLKTPLAGIRLYCELRDTEKSDPHTQKELQLIERMENLIYKLLRLEKLLSDAYLMEFREYELAALAEEVIGELRHLYPDKNYIVEGGGTFRCDKAWLSEALGNLIKNSGEHTAPDGMILVKISAGDKYAEVTVEDDGGGIPSEEIPKLFSRFYRTEDAPPESTGIGMAITKAIVEKHHGTISAQNGAKGLKIIMSFPMIDGNLKI